MSTRKTTSQYSKKDTGLPGVFHFLSGEWLFNGGFDRIKPDNLVQVLMDRRLTRGVGITLGIDLAIVVFVRNEEP